MIDKFITKSSQQTFDFGRSFADKLKPNDTIFLNGDLGSGKTTFVKGLALGLGIDKRIVSPTFVLVRNYRVGDRNNEAKIFNLYHLDLYRIENLAQLKEIDLLEMQKDKNGVIVIEWPELAFKYFKNKKWVINFSHLDNDERELVVYYE